MKFNIKIWRKYYDNVQKLGSLYAQTMPGYTLDEQGVWVKKPPKKPMKPADKRTLENKIDFILDKSNNYLNACGMNFVRIGNPYNKERDR